MVSIPVALLAAAAAARLTLAASDTSDFGSFSNPSITVRPRFRYWVPDASIDLDQMADDIAEIGRIGCSGIELLGYYLYGYQQSSNEPVATDWTKYSWGTPAWKSLNDAALQASKDNGLIMDYTLGPNQGAGVPSEPDAEGLLWTLDPFNVSVPLGGTFDDTLPGWGSGDLVSASTGLVLNTTATGGSPSTNATLKTSSLQDVTHLVDDSGHLNITFPSGEGDHYQVFAYYQVHSGYRELPPSDEITTSVPQSPITSFVYNGSWVVDHFSAKGAQAIIDFWEEYLLGGDTKDLLRDVGHYSWEDSQEYVGAFTVFWTPGMLDSFNSSRGYAAQKFLPTFFRTDNVGFSSVPSDTLYLTDEADQGISHSHDWRQTATELNLIYVQALTNWTQSLGNGFSAQVGYNLALDMLESIPLVDAPECESLGFNHLIDGYKQFSGAANLAGKQVISSELGAIDGAVFQQSLPELIWDVKRSIVGGVNQFVYHGFPYSGNYPNTTWPVFTTFQYQFSGMNGPHQPGWDYYPEYMNWTARVQWASQSGIAKRDVAIYLKVDEWFNALGPQEPKYPTDDLVNAGYAYEYLDPSNFGLPAATVSNNILAPSQQAFKALVVPSNASLTVFGVQKLTDYANEGLPIFFSGGVPANFYGYNTSGQAYVESAIGALAKMSNVHTVSDPNSLASTLAAQGIAPRTAISANATWYTNWRQDGSTTYAFVYNDATGVERNGGFSEGNVTFEAVGVPHWYDAWTGDITPVAAFTQTDDTTTVPLQLAGNQSAIVAFVSGTAPPHVASAPPGSTVSGSTLVVKAAEAGTVTFTNGSTKAVDGGAAPTQLTAWNLTLESWTPGANLSDVNGARTNSSHQLTSLQSWIDIGAANVSGRGFYSTTFDWNSTDGAYLDLGSIVHTAQAALNGHALPPLDPTWARTDIGAFLKQGANTLEVVVSSTLGNAAGPLWGQLLSGGTPALGPVPGGDEYGLLSPAAVVPYTTTHIAL